jgi:hypothetical protein
MKWLPFLICAVLSIVFLTGTVSAVGNISVTSTPSGATILIDDASTGQVTPATVESVIAGSHTIKVRFTGYTDFVQSGVVVTDNATTTVSATLIASTPPPAISSINPTFGLNSGVVTVTLAGTGFSTSGATVVLTKSGETNIVTMSSPSVSATQITCNFDITSKTTGNWNVIVTNPDSQSSTLSNGFEIRSPATAITLSSITPSSAINDSVVTITNLAGNGFTTGATMKLKMYGANDIPGTITSWSNTQITGTFNLISRTPGAYEVCVSNDGVTNVCGLTFTINSPNSVTNGSVRFESNPSNAAAYLDSVYQGKTPVTVYNVTPGTYTALMQKSGYLDYSKTIKVTAGNRTYISVSLNDEYTTTESTPVPTTTITTARPTIKSSLKAPTPWPSDTPTPASPLSALVIIGAVGLGFIVIRKP